MIHQANMTCCVFSAHCFFIPDPFAKKYSRLKIRQSTIYHAGLLGQWDKRIVDQESDVPSIIFLYFL